MQLTSALASLQVGPTRRLVNAQKNSLFWTEKEESERNGVGFKSARKQQKAQEEKP